MAKVAIVGVGAIGGALAGLLETAGGHQISLCTRRPLPRLTVKTPEREFEVHARNFTDPRQADAVDWVLVATKTYDAAGAAAWFPALCAAGAPVAIVQNGVEHRERFAAWVSAERLLPVVIDCPVERAEGKVLVRGGALMKVENTPLGRSFAALFAASGARLDVVDDFTTAMWWKLCVNAVGALNALTLRPAGVLREEAMRRLGMALVAECAAVARAEGAHLDASSIGEEVMALYAQHPVDSVNSLLADRLAGRRMEWDARTGAIVRKGEKHGLDTPLNRMAATLLAAAENDRV